ncbi:MAG: cytochrome c-type biogenesis protein CcmH, partial [Pseudomonadota bacterium]
EIRDWFADRYGEFVLFRPRTAGLPGIVLWGAPLMALVLGGLVVLATRRPRSDIAPVAPEALGDEHGDDVAKP